MSDTPPLHVLNLLGCYWPGNDATGPNQSMKALARALDGQAAFHVLAMAKGLEAAGRAGWVDMWGHDGLTHVRYRPIGRFGARGLGTVIRQTPHDILMLNGVFDRGFTLPALLQRRLGRIPRTPTMVSPRGEFSPGALDLKGGRKQLFLTMAKRSKLFGDVWLHATGETEAEDIARTGLKSRGILIAPNGSDLPDCPLQTIGEREPRTPLRIAFLGRVTPKKNLDYALDVLKSVETAVQFDIFGPLVDPDHWAACERKIRALPDYIQASHKGVIPHRQVVPRLADYDLFFFPTRGENFGHVISESLAAGTPLLISDTTPWRGLAERSIGWDLPLEAPERFARAIEDMARMPKESYKAMRRAARAHAETVHAAKNTATVYMETFRTMIAAAPHHTGPALRHTGDRAGPGV